MSTSAEDRTAARTAAVDGLEKLRAAFPLDARVRGASPAAQAAYGRVLRAWLGATAPQAAGLAPDALGELLAEMGGDLRRLMGEVDKLEAWAGGRKEITAEDLAAALGRGLGQPLYLLSDASHRELPWVPR